MATHRVKILERRAIAENTSEYVLERPNDFHFKAGQYIQVRLPKLHYFDTKGASRVFTIASSPLEKEHIRIAFRTSSSSFKRTMSELPLGAEITIEGPHGFLVLERDNSVPIVFIAGGIGITPCASMARYATEKGFSTPITLLYANRSRESAPYLRDMQSLSGINPHLTVNSILGRIDERCIKKHVKNMYQCVWHIAGPPPMVNAMRNILALCGVDSTKVHYEAFTGY
tara:strand:- start:26 stop:709 length:684 start_codon:yes stop_codon:yes gene_type:complete